MYHKAHNLKLLTNSLTNYDSDARRVIIVWRPFHFNLIIQLCIHVSESRCCGRKRMRMIPPDQCQLLSVNRLRYFHFHLLRVLSVRLGAATGKGVSYLQIFQKIEHFLVFIFLPLSYCERWHPNNQLNNRTLQTWLGGNGNPLEVRHLWKGTQGTVEFCPSSRTVHNRS